MPVINLREQRKAWLSGVEHTGLWQDGSKVWAKPVDGPVWTPIIPFSSGAASQGGVVTQNPDGSHRVSSPEDVRFGARAACALPPAGAVVTLETSIAFDDATRIVVRQVTDGNQSTGVTVFDVNRPAVGASIVRTDTFTVQPGYTLLHFVGVMPASSYFTINAATRYRVS